MLAVLISHETIQESYTSSDGPINMEALPINDGNGQSYGYTLYTATVSVPSATDLTIRGYVRYGPKLLWMTLV